MSAKRPAAPRPARAVWPGLVLVLAALALGWFSLEVPAASTEHYGLVVAAILSALGGGVWLVRRRRR